MKLLQLPPGKPCRAGRREGIELICQLLNKDHPPGQSTIILLETMSGKGSEVGGKFEELRAIIDEVEQKDKIGVCMDTCHVSDAGYDIINDLDGVLDEFDRIVGWSEASTPFTSATVSTRRVPIRIVMQRSEKGSSVCRPSQTSSAIPGCRVFRASQHQTRAGIRERDRDPAGGICKVRSLTVPVKRGLPSGSLTQKKIQQAVS